jgi:hypothetical protein
LYKSCGVGGKLILSNTWGFESCGLKDMSVMNPITAVIKITRSILFFLDYSTEGALFGKF